MNVTNARHLGPKGSQDDLVLDLGEGSSKASHHIQPAPHSAPRRLLSSPQEAKNADPPSPTKSRRSDLKGKGKAYEPTDSFLKRLAGPSTGKAGLLRDPEEVRQIVRMTSACAIPFRDSRSMLCPDLGS